MPLPALGAVLLALGVLFGAFGAHGLEGRVSPERMDTWNTAALYHLVNALGILVLGTLKELAPDRVAARPVAFILMGAVVFPGSLYALVLLDVQWLGAIAPLGGISLVVGWMGIGLGELRRKSTGHSDSTQ